MPLSPRLRSKALWKVALWKVAADALHLQPRWVARPWEQVVAGRQWQAEPVLLEVVAVLSLQPPCTPPVSLL